MTSLLGVIFVWVVYHIVREILQDAIGIKHRLVTIGHKPHKRPLFLGEYFSKFWGFIFEIPILILCIYYFFFANFVVGISVILLFISYFIFWIISTY